MTKGYVLITGASEGMGQEFARLFARNGYPLVLVARNKLRLDELAVELTTTNPIDIRTISKDLSLPASAEEIKTELNEQKIAIEILVNNAGFGVHGFFHQTDWKATEAMLNLNMITLTHLTRLLLPGMLERGHGKILNIASTAAFQPGPLMACYFASKAYTLSFTEALANELSGTGVTATAFCPGPVKTLFQKRSNTENIRENSFAMDAITATAAAYRGLMKGKTLVIPGFTNKLLAILVRLAPRWLVIKVTRFLEENG
ncbi:MAG: SDR family oxidoreductase [Candidatus Omnitrophica bacterium]|nr:SDR family oxidoreductase [Candidatus Omnitrophota bacterium]